MRRMWERGALAWCDGWEEGNHSHAYSPVCPYAKSEPHEAVLLVLFGSRFVDSANVGLLHRTQHLCWYRRDDFPDRRLGEYLRRLRALDRVSILSFFHKLRHTMGDPHFQFGPLHRHEYPQKTGPHSIGFSGGQLPSACEGSSALDFPLIHDTRSQNQL